MTQVLQLPVRQDPTAVTNSEWLTASVRIDATSSSWFVIGRGSTGCMQARVRGFIATLLFTHPSIHYRKCTNWGDFQSLGAAMARSKRPRLGDLRALYRLIGECRELGADATEWRLHLLEGLRQLVDAQVALYMQIEGIGTETQVIHSPLDSGFLDQQGRDCWVAYQRERAYLDDPFHLSFYAKFGTALRTRRLREVVDTSTWQQSRHYNDYVRPCGLEDRITSSLRLSESRSSLAQVIVLHRASKDGDYPEPARRLVHLFHLELRSSLGGPLAMPEGSDGGPMQLPLRLRQVLAGLLMGESEKEIAVRLQISRHTVNRHMQRLHQRFNVRSRGELAYRCRDMLPALLRSL